MLISPNLSLPYIDVNEAQREVVHNEAIRGLDALVQLAVLDRNLATPPGSPSNGQRWLVAASPTGAWSGHATEIAAWQDGAWRFYAPRTGWLVYVVDEGALLGWNGTAWADALSMFTSFQNVTLFGIGTTADAVNPFSAKLNNALWVGKTVAEGGDGHLRYKMSKESASKTLSLLMQTNFSGRAEIGLTGDDDLHVKVSADGSTWFDSLVIAGSSGKVGLGVDGSSAAPALTWAGDPDNGLYRTGANAWSLACAGAQAIGLTATAVSVPYTTAATSTTTGSLVNAGGFGNAGAAYFGSTVNITGTLTAATVSVSGTLQPSANNSKDIGSTSLTWRDLLMSGIFYLGKTVANTTSPGMYIAPPGGGGQPPVAVMAKSASGLHSALQFWHSGSYVGGLDFSNTSTTLQTSSDKRLKEDARSIDALSIIADLEVWDFRWKATGHREIGMFAQDVAPVFPQAVAHKEAVDWWGIAKAELAPLAIRGIQQLRQEIEALRAMVQ